MNTRKKPNTLNETLIVVSYRLLFALTVLAILFILAIIIEKNTLMGEISSLFENYLTASALRCDVTSSIACAVGTTSLVSTQY